MKNFDTSYNFSAIKEITEKTIKLALTEANRFMGVSDFKCVKNIHKIQSYTPSVVWIKVTTIGTFQTYSF